MRTLILTLLAALAAVSCSGAVENEIALPTTGKWGGPDIQVTVTSQAATTQFVCAHGTIDQPITPDGNGNFTASGTYVFEFTAIVPGQPSSESHSAKYDGQLSGSTMRISVTVPDKQQVFGPFVA